MPKRRRLKDSRSLIVLTLLAIALLGLLLPPRWTSRLSGLTQVLVPLQDAVGRLAGRGPDAADERTGVVAAEQYESVRRKKLALENQVAALTLRVNQLENDVEVLTGTRVWEIGGQRIGVRGRLLPARVISEDLLAWRSSRLINSGSLQGVRRGHPILTDKFTVDLGSEQGVRSGLAILLREALVGFVHDAEPHTSRVQLLSDPAVELKVRIGRFEESTFLLLDGEFWMRGTGAGRMSIRDVERRDVDSGAVKVGDVVLSAPNAGPHGANLPVALRVGAVEEIQVDRANPLLAVLTVETAVAEYDLGRVFVYDPATPAKTR